MSDLYSTLEQPIDDVDYYTELILTYVPESEYIDFPEALALAIDRDMEAAIVFEMDVKYG